MSKPLPPGSVIGILGGGQLGQMLAMAAARLGFKCHIYSDSAESPATLVAAQTVIGAYDDAEKVKAFAKDVDVLTYEFENVPSGSAAAAEGVTCLYPGARALDVAQDRLTEKTFISETAGVPVAPFVDLEKLSDFSRVPKPLTLPVVIKTRRMGYDGKGQIIVRDATKLEDAVTSLGDVPLIAEQFIPFKREVSVVTARSASGETAAYPLIENVHKNHILHISTAPATGDNGKAQELAIKIMTALDYVGVMATEFFEMEDGSLLVNEIAPRVHNSGHWTQNAGCVDQFELHIRAIAGWALGSTVPRYKVQMFNLIGDDVELWKNLASDPDAHIHLYGKAETRHGRKMGHINRIFD